MEENKSHRLVIHSIGKYDIIRLYADAVYEEDDEHKRYPYYGDIYDSLIDLAEDHPLADVLEGFGIIDKETGYGADESEDWYDELEDAIKDVVKLIKKETSVEKKWFDIVGSIEVDVDEVSFNKELLQWLESKGWSFVGLTKPAEE